MSRVCDRLNRMAAPCASGIGAMARDRFNKQAWG